MTMPTVAVNTTNLDSDTDSPLAARPDLLDLAQKVNQIIAHISTFAATILDDADQAAVRATLGLGALATKSTVATADHDNDSVTYAKMQNVSATDKLLGRSTAGAGDPEEIACTAAGRAILDDADAAAQRTTLGAAPTASPTFTGDPKLTMGAGAGTAPLVGVANVNTTAVGNVGPGPDNLMTYSLPANSLSVNGKAVRVTAWGATANNANTKTVYLTFGSLSNAVTLTPSASKNWRINMIVVRTGSNAQKVYVEIFEASYTTPIGTDGKFSIKETTTAQTDTAAISIACQGDGASDNDVVQQGMIVEFLN